MLRNRLRAAPYLGLIALVAIVGAGAFPALAVENSTAAEADSVAQRLDAQNTEISELYGEGEYEKAIALTRQHLEEWARTEGEDSEAWCSMVSNLGPLLSKQGDLAAASEAYRTALDCGRRVFGPDSEDMASTLNNYGSHLGALAEFERAELALEQSLTLLRRSLGEDHLYVAITLNNLAINQQNQGNLYLAEKTLREALKRLRGALGDDHKLTATAMNNLGRLLATRGEWEEAEPLLVESLRVRREQLGAQDRDTLISLRDLARLEFRRDRPEAAVPLFREALAGFVANTGEEDADVAMTRHGLGRALRAQGDVAASREELEESLRVREMLFERGHSSHVELHRELGEMAFEAGDTREALARLVRATEEFEVGRAQAGRGLARATYLDNPWLERSAIELELGGYDEAWTSLQHAQAPVLSEALAIDTLGAADPASIGASLGHQRAMLGWLDADLGEARRSWVWVLRADSVEWRRLPVSEKSAGLTSEFRRTVARPGPLGELKQRAHELWSARVRPIEPALEGVDELVVVDGGAMSGVPVGALVDDDGSWLADRWLLSSTPSPEIFVWLKERQPSLAREALFVGDPSYRGTQGAPSEVALVTDDVIRGAAHGEQQALDELPALPGSRVEIQELESIWPRSTVLLGDDASEQKLEGLASTGALSQFRVLHFAAHALVDSDDADAAALILAQRGIPDVLEQLTADTTLFDGRLTSGEIVDNWKLDADLVTLSACNSALGRAVDGEGYVGFAQAFLRSGARATLLSLWSVPDRATSELMARFYENWYSQGKSKARALALAQRQLRSLDSASGRPLYDHPYYWSPFILIGDAR